MFSGRLFRESVLMKKSLAVSVLAAAVLLAGCQSVNTTSGGAVGVERKQYMFSMLSSQEVDQMYAQSYQQTLGEASGKGLVYLAAESPYPGGIGILVPQNSSIKTVRDLKGKKVAVGKGYNVQYALIKRSKPMA